MAQVQKESVRNLIIHSALTLFATKGYNDTSIADIAKTAGISVGNVYRYFKSKNEVLEEVIPEEFVLNLHKQIVKKIETGKSVTILEQSKDKAYITNSEQFYEFLITNRLRFMTLMKCTKKKEYANFKEELLDYLVQIFLDKFVASLEEQEKMRSTIILLYRGFIDLCTAVLAMECEESIMLEELEKITHYHIFGLASLVEKK